MLMSLTNLKKSKGSKITKEKFSVDDFIADAENYAKGSPQIVSGDPHGKKNLKQAKSDANKPDANKPDANKSGANKSDASKSGTSKSGANKPDASKSGTSKPDAKLIIKQKKPPKKQGKPFRRATFTLSEEAIDQLQYLTKETNLAKSHIIRILIDELSNKEQEEQIKGLFKSDVL